MEDTIESAMNDPQRARAHKIACQLTGKTDPSPSLVRALLGLVEADEKYIPDSPPRWRKPTCTESRTTPSKPKPAPVVTPRVTTPQPEPNLTLF